MTAFSEQAGTIQLPSTSTGTTIDIVGLMSSLMPVMMVIMMMGVMVKAAGGSSGNGGGQYISKGVEGSYANAIKSYRKPKAVSDGLRQSINEELTASAWYHMRAENARAHGDEKSAALYEHIAGEEDGHKDEFSKRLREVLAI